MLPQRNIALIALAVMAVVLGVALTAQDPRPAPPSLPEPERAPLPEVKFAPSVFEIGDLGFKTQDGESLDVPYVPTPEAVVHAMLRIANVGADDILYDLGSGDGRIVITAARDLKIKKGVGVDLDRARITEANTAAQAANVADRVTFHQGDLFAFDFTEATVLTMYLLPEVNLKLRPTILDRMKPGTRVVSHAFNMGDWEWDGFEIVGGLSIYLWIVPAQVAGTWQWLHDGKTHELNLTQRYQKISGTLRTGETSAPLISATLQGSTISFRVQPQETDDRADIIAFNGEVQGDSIVAVVSRSGRDAPITATRMH